MCARQVRKQNRRRHPTPRTRSPPSILRERAGEIIECEIIRPRVRARKPNAENNAKPSFAVQPASKRESHGDTGEWGGGWFVKGRVASPSNRLTIVISTTEQKFGNNTHTNGAT